MEKGFLVLILIVVLTLSSVISNYNAFFSYNKEVKLPKEKILDKISDVQKELALRYGYTLIYYNYTNDFDEVKNYLESLAMERAFYLIINEGNNRIVVESLRGKRESENVTLNETLDLICEIAIDAPLECALRGI